MEKQSQKRSLKDIIREKNPLHSASEFFNTKLTNLMVSMRKTDSEIREIVIGGKKNRSLKDIIKHSRSLYNKKEYINSFIVLDEFRENLGKVSAKCESLSLDINVSYKEFFINELSRSEKDSLVDFREKLDQELNKKKADSYYTFVKQAGFLDFFRSIFTQRGRALRAWEKAHGKEIEKMKDGLVVLFNSANSTLDGVNEELKTMSFALSTRDVSAFNKASKNIITKYNSFNKEYKIFYKNNIKDLINDLSKEPAEPITEPEAEDRSTLIMSPEESAKLESRTTIPSEPLKDSLSIPPSNENVDVKEDDKQKPKAKKPKSKKAMVNEARARLEKLAKLI